MYESTFIPFPTLTTRRLILRQIEAGDDQDIFAHRADEQVNAYLENFSHASLEHTRAFIDRIHAEVTAGRSVLWVLSRKEDPRFMGTICLWNIDWEKRSAETGYTLHPPFHKMGYMNEALEKVIDYGFNSMNLAMIHAYTHELNESSVRLLERNHFRQEPVPENEAGSNMIFFALTSGQYGRVQQQE